MEKCFAAAVLCSGLIAALPANAKITGVTADGTWDCTDSKDAYFGTIVVANTSYAFINLDGRVGTYGNLKQVGLADLDLPAFVVLDGYLKDEMAAAGMSMTGPRDNPNDLKGEHFLNIIIADENYLYCTGRKQPAP